ncbi:unnamed protein product [Diplocarpon coronariae]
MFSLRTAQGSRQPLSTLPSPRLPPPSPSHSRVLTFHLNTTRNKIKADSEG